MYIAMSDTMAQDCFSLPPAKQCAGVTINRRRLERVTVMREVNLRTSDGWQFSAMCTDVNLGGIGLETEHVLKVGQRLELELTTHNGCVQQVPLMVIYRMGTHYGLSAIASLDELLELLPEQA